MSTSGSGKWAAQTDGGLTIWGGRKEGVEVRELVLRFAFAVADGQDAAKKIGVPLILAAGPCALHLGKLSGDCSLPAQER